MIAPRTITALASGVAGAATLGFVVFLLAASGSDTVTYARLDGVASLDPAARGLSVVGTHGACDELLPLEVTETAAEVRVRVPLRRTGSSCDDVALPLTVRVDLEQALGQRVVIDVQRSTRLSVVG